MVVNTLRESTAVSDYNFSEIPGMNCGKMFKLSEVMTSYMGNNYGQMGAESNLFQNMVSTLYQSETRKSCIGDNFLKNMNRHNNRRVAMSVFEGSECGFNEVRYDYHLFRRQIDSKIPKL